MSTIWLDTLGATVRYYDAGGVRTRTIEAGEGEPVVLLHGLSGHAETWSKNIIPLAEQFHVYAVDMVGHGLSAKPEQTYSIAAFSRHLADLLDAVGAESAHLVGQSLGGWVAGWFAVEHPERVKSLSFITTAGLQVTQEQQAIGQTSSQVRNVTRAALDAPTRESVRKRLEWLMFDPTTVTEELVEVRYHIYTRPDTQAVVPRLVDDVTGDVRAPYMLTTERLQKLTMPALVLWTRHNPTTQWPEGEAAAKVLPNGQFILLEEAAHWPQFEKAERFNEILGQFLTTGRLTEAAAAAAAR